VLVLAHPEQHLATPVQWVSARQVWPQNLLEVSALVLLAVVEAVLALVGVWQVVVAAVLLLWARADMEWLLLQVAPPLPPPPLLVPQRVD
jgi:hypothetical protein